MEKMQAATNLQSAGSTKWKQTFGGKQNDQNEVFEMFGRGSSCPPEAQVQLFDEKDLALSDQVSESKSIVLSTALSL